MLKEVLEYLGPERDEKFIDCTLGDGGHALALLKAEADVLGIDISEDAVKRARERIMEEKLSKAFIARKGNFADILEVAVNSGFEHVNGILFDLGYSSSQLNQDLGISFQQDQPLDMRLDKSLGVTAAELVNSLPENQLAEIIYGYSDEKLARKFAKEIVKRRGLKKFHSTKDLADFIKNVAPLGYERGRIHPATRTFQALRIAVNSDLDNLKTALPQAARLLLPGGRMVVISFHSLEDRTVKQFGRGAQPTIAELTKKPLVPMEAEVSANPRARSAKMRVYEKI